MEADARAMLQELFNHTGDSPPMSFLIERKTQTIFVTATSIAAKGKARKMVIESRPEYVVVQLLGIPEKYPIPWEEVYDLAQRRNEENLRLERESMQKTKRSSRMRGSNNL